MSMTNANAHKEQPIQGQIPMLHPQTGGQGHGLGGLRGNLSPTSHIHHEPEDRRNPMMIQGSQPTVKSIMYLKIGNNTA
jgi:hypothetical protein